MDEFLKNVGIFAGLPADDLQRVSEIVVEIELAAGQQLFAEGDVGDRAYIIREGLVEVFKDTEEGFVLLAVLKVGDILGEMSLVEGGNRMASARARTACCLMAIGREEFDHLLKSSPKATLGMLHTITGRLRVTEQKVHQQAKLAQLGQITASVSHELAEPAPRTQREAEQLRDLMGDMAPLWRELYETRLSAEQIRLIFSLEERLHRHARNPLNLMPAEQKKRQAELETVLKDWGLEKSRVYAPMLLNLGYETKRLTDWVHNFTPAQLKVGLTWLGKAYQMYTSLEKIRRGSMRVFEVSQALKFYAEIDESELGTVDIYDELENALFIFRDYFGEQSIVVERLYGEELPIIMGYSNDVNQVFVHLISNAIESMHGKGTLTIHPYTANNYMVIEIIDSGPGISMELQAKLFDPFFTTKNPGASMGLGLHVSRKIVMQKHRGQISVESEPGRTCIMVRLPLNLEA